MKSKLIKTLLPTLFGVLTVLGILLLIQVILHPGNVSITPDKGFFSLFVPIVTLIALLIQFTLTLPFWKKFKTQKKVWGLKLVPFTIILSLFSGLIFGWVFWETNLGIKEWIVVSLTGIFAFAIYWTINLLTLKQLDR